jgi:hypothetical protein
LLIRSASYLGRCDKSFKQPQVIERLLRVPLDCQTKWVILNLNGLDDAVWRVCDNLQTLSWLIDGLVVVESSVINLLPDN